MYFRVSAMCEFLPYYVQKIGRDKGMPQHKEQKKFVWSYSKLFDELFSYKWIYSIVSSFSEKIPKKKYFSYFSSKEFT